MLDDFRIENVSARRFAGIPARVQRQELPTTIIKLPDRIWPILRSRSAQTGHNVVIYREEPRGCLDIVVGVEVLDGSSQRVT